MKLAALGLGYAAASDWVGVVKSTLCRWLQREPLGRPQLTGRVLELDGWWTRTAAGPRAFGRFVRNVGLYIPLSGIKYGAGFIDTAPKAWPDQSNHLKRNATFSCFALAERAALAYNRLITAGK